MSDNLVRIFISHASEDEAIAKSITKLLRTALSLVPEAIRNTSWTPTGLPFGGSIDSDLRAEVIDADVLIGIVTPRSVTSPWVLFEFGARWGTGRSFIPVLAGGADSSLIPGPIRAKHACKLSISADIQKFVAQVAESLKEQLPTAILYSDEGKELERVSVSSSQMEGHLFPTAARRDTGIRAIYSKTQSPWNADSFAELTGQCKRISIVGTGHIDFITMLSDSADKLGDKLLSGELYLEVLLADPSWEEYLAFRTRELWTSGSTRNIQEHVRSSYKSAVEFKTRLLRQAATTEQAARVVRGLVISTYKSSRANEFVPRTAIIRADNRLFFRHYRSVERGSSSKFVLEAEQDHPVAQGYLKEFERMRKSAIGSLLPVHCGNIDAAYTGENRDVCHNLQAFAKNAPAYRLRLLHPTVHVICIDDQQNVYLQLRSADTDSNPLSWTSTCSGHLQLSDMMKFEECANWVSDARSDIPVTEEAWERAYRRELAEEIQISGFMQIEDTIDLGEVLNPYRGDPEPAACNALSRLYVIKFSNLAPAASPEVKEIKAFTIDSVDKALRIGGELYDTTGRPWPFARNFKHVWNAMRDAKA